MTKCLAVIRANVQLIIRIYHDATFTHNYSAHGPFTRSILDPVYITFMMASGIARCSLNAVLDDVNFFKGHPYFKGTMSDRTGESVL